ncbi:MAG TPA: long-chain fatty acid--CoA ligase [Actinomycetota bacterium]|nr:long-chain fatty acid--CoA ligase [Actinomycetota bacterium]
MTIPGLMQHTPLTLRAIFDRMRDVYADGKVVSPEGRTTYGALSEEVLKLVTVLHGLGVRSGDRVGTFAFNSARHFALYHAVPLIGAVLHTINVRLYDEQIAYIANHAEDRVIFVDAELCGALAEVAPKLATVGAYVVMGDGDAHGLTPAHDYDSLLSAAAPAAPDSLPTIDEHAGCGLCYTSGTTGMPKGVLSSHRGMWLHSMATAMAGTLALTETDRVFPIVPMFHAFGWGLPYAAPFAGAELIFHGSDSSAANIGRIIEQERVTLTAGVPTIWKDLLPLIERKDVDASSLRGIYVGGSALPRPLIDAYDKQGIEIVQMWGMTETGPLACISLPRRGHRGLDRDGLLDQREKTGTIFPGLEARIVAPDGSVCPRDGKTVGELECRGPWIASAYYNDPEGSREKFHDGWLRTGDMAFMEPDGTFRIVDRAKDLVKSGGEWISSVELEGALLGHPLIRDAAVVGIRSRKWDERPVAVVVPAGDEHPTLESVREFLTPLVAKWWLPDGVVIVDEIPKTSVGKIDKKVIRAQLDHMELP